MRNSPVAQKLLFLNKKKKNALNIKNTQCSQIGLLFVVICLADLIIVYIEQIVVFLKLDGSNLALPGVKLMTLDLRSLSSLFI